MNSSTNTINFIIHILTCKFLFSYSAAVSVALCPHQSIFSVSGYTKNIFWKITVTLAEEEKYMFEIKKI